MNVGHHDASSLSVGLKGEVPTREVEGTEVPLFSASASTKQDTALVSLSNLDAESARTVVLDLRGREVTGFSGRVLTAPAPQTHNTPDQPAAVAPVPLQDMRRHERGLEVVLPPHSYATVSLELV